MQARLIKYLYLLTRILYSSFFEIFVEKNKNIINTLIYIVENDSSYLFDYIYLKY